MDRGSDFLPDTQRHFVPNSKCSWNPTWPVSESSIACVHRKSEHLRMVPILLQCRGKHSSIMSQFLGLGMLAPPWSTYQS
jgi:hypothetical protein